MPRAVERIMRGNGERERMGESIVGESSRTFNEVYVTSLRYTDPLGQLLTLYLVLEDRRLWHGQTRFDNEHDNECLYTVERDYNHRDACPYLRNSIGNDRFGIAGIRCIEKNMNVTRPSYLVILSLIVSRTIKLQTAKAKWFYLL